jgi:hypothetical protein
MHIVMEYASGGTLAKRIALADGEYFDESQIWEWFVQIVDALRYVHSRGVLHRDLKPANIMLSGAEGRTVKLGDFGIAKILGKEERAATIVGTPHYLSPEVCSGQQYNVKSDVWALGCVLYELAALRKPFDGSNLPGIIFSIMRNRPQPLPKHFSRELRAMVAVLLSPTPADRPSLNQLWKMPVVSSHYLRWKGTRRMVLGELPTPRKSAGGFATPPIPGHNTSQASNLESVPDTPTVVAGGSISVGQFGMTTPGVPLGDGWDDSTPRTNGLGPSSGRRMSNATSIDPSPRTRRLRAPETDEILATLKSLMGEAATAGVGQRAPPVAPSETVAEGDEAAASQTIEERLETIQHRLEEPGSAAPGNLWEALGRAWAEMGWFDKAITAYRMALKRSGSGASVGAMEQLGNLLVRRAQQVWSLARMGDVDTAMSLMQGAAGHRLKRAVLSFVRRQKTALNRFDSTEPRVADADKLRVAGAASPRRDSSPARPQTTEGIHAKEVTVVESDDEDVDPAERADAARPLREGQPERRGSDASEQSRLHDGTRRSVAEPSAPPAEWRKLADELMIEGLGLLERLCLLVNAPEPKCLLGSAYKRRAWTGLGSDPEEDLRRAADAYKEAHEAEMGALEDVTGVATGFATNLQADEGEGSAVLMGPDVPVPSPYARLNQLTLELLSCDGEPDQLRTMRAAVREAEGWSRARVERNPADVWTWLQLVDARFLRLLLGDRQLKPEDVAGQYMEQFRFGASQRVRSSVLDQMAFLIDVLDRRILALNERLSSVPRLNINPRTPGEGSSPRSPQGGEDESSSSAVGTEASSTHHPFLASQERGVKWMKKVREGVMDMVQRLSDAAKADGAAPTAPNDGEGGEKEGQGGKEHAADEAVNKFFATVLAQQPSGDMPPSESGAGTASPSGEGSSFRMVRGASGGGTDLVEPRSHGDDGDSLGGRSSSLSDRSHRNTRRLGMLTPDDINQDNVAASIRSQGGSNASLSLAHSFSGAFGLRTAIKSSPVAAALSPIHSAHVSRTDETGSIALRSRAGGRADDAASSKLKGGETHTGLVLAQAIQGPSSGAAAPKTPAGDLFSIKEEPPRAFERLDAHQRSHTMPRNLLATAVPSKQPKLSAVEKAIEGEEAAPFEMAGPAPGESKSRRSGVGSAKKERPFVPQLGLPGKGSTKASGRLVSPKGSGRSHLPVSGRSGVTVTASGVSVTGSTSIRPDSMNPFSRQSGNRKAPVGDRPSSVVTGAGGVTNPFSRQSGNRKAPVGDRPSSVVTDAGGVTNPFSRQSGNRKAPVGDRPSSVVTDAGGVTNPFSRQSGNRKAPVGDRPSSVATNAGGAPAAQPPVSRHSDSEVPASVPAEEAGTPSLPGPANESPPRRDTEGEVDMTDSSPAVRERPGSRSSGSPLPEVQKIAVSTRPSAPYAVAIGEDPTSAEDRDVAASSRTHPTSITPRSSHVAMIEVKPSSGCRCVVM